MSTPQTKPAWKIEYDRIMAEREAEAVKIREEIDQFKAEIRAHKRILDGINMIGSAGFGRDI